MGQSSYLLSGKRETGITSHFQAVGSLLKNNTVIFTSFALLLELRRVNTGLRGEEMEKI
jgi:hypothetical protein